MSRLQHLVVELQSQHHQLICHHKQEQGKSRHPSEKRKASKKVTVLGDQALDQRSSRIGVFGGPCLPCQNLTYSLRLSQRQKE